MKIPRHSHPTHECAPKVWRDTPQITGCYELDAGIMRNENRDLPARVRMFIEPNNNLYGPKTGYGGYRGYSGDD